MTRHKRIRIYYKSFAVLGLDGDGDGDGDLATGDGDGDGRRGFEIWRLGDQSPALTLFKGFVIN